jgi:hypothetical protein
MDDLRRFAFHFLKMVYSDREQTNTSPSGANNSEILRTSSNVQEWTSLSQPQDRNRAGPALSMCRRTACVWAGFRASHRELGYDLEKSSGIRAMRSVPQRAISSVGAPELSFQMLTADKACAVVIISTVTAWVEYLRADLGSAFGYVVQKNWNHVA